MESLFPYVPLCLSFAVRVNVLEQSTCQNFSHILMVLKMFYFSCGYSMISEGNSSALEQSEGQFANKSTVLYIVNVFSCTKRSSIPVFCQACESSLDSADS